MKVLDLKTEYLTNPIGIDNISPRFSWITESDIQDTIQKSYRIIVKSGNHIKWDTGTVLSDESSQIKYDGEPLFSREQLEWTVSVETEKESAVSDTAFFEMGLLEPSDWKAEWIEPENQVDRQARKPSPYLRKTFIVSEKIKKARIYQTCHGLYDCRINNNPITDDKFNPGFTSYYHRIQYQVYDITDLITEGKNCWSVVLGDGWWRGVTGGTVINNFGKKLHYLGQIELIYEDGKSEIIKTDESFRWNTGGLIASDMLMGDIFDSRLEPVYWRTPEFDDSSWENVHLTNEHTDADLICCAGVPVREKEQFEPEIFTDNAGNTVLDFGQNIAGYVKMKLRSPEKGKAIKLTHGETLDKNGVFTTDNICNTSIKTQSFQTVEYIGNGEPIEEYVPKFSVFGFRYVKLENYFGEIRKGDFIAVAVYSDMEVTGNFTCSNTLINKLVSNALRSQKGNYLDVATDCPTRERNSWTGDNQVYCRTSTYFMDVYKFYEKWMKDQAIEQFESGKVGITFPSTSSPHDPEEKAIMQKSNPLVALAGPCGEGSIGEDCAGWGDACAWIPNVIYSVYKDKTILLNQFNCAKKWVDYILECAKEHNPLYENEPQYHNCTYGVPDAEFIYDTRMHYGEWEEPIPKEPTGETLAEKFMRMVKEGKPLVATAYMFRSALNVAEMANYLGKSCDARYYSETASKIKNIYNKYFIKENGEIEPGHQASYVRVLAFGLVNETNKPKVEAQLISEIKANNYRLNTGFLSTPFLLPVLVKMGRTDLAYRLLEQEEYPGWLKSVKLGATTIPERWDGFVERIDSLNHYSYGAVCEFLFSHVAGIKPQNGYKSFILEPIIGGNIDFAEGAYKSQYGIIKSKWEIKGESIIYTCSIPANTKAQLHLPGMDTKNLGSGTYKFTVKR